MTESSRTKSLLAAWRQRHGRRAFAGKTNDLSTKGRPDTFFIFYGHHCWIEFKHPKRGENVLNMVEELQAITMWEMHAAGAHVYLGEFLPKKMLRLWHQVDVRTFAPGLFGPEAYVIDHVTAYPCGQTFVGRGRQVPR